MERDLVRECCRHLYQTTLAEVDKHQIPHVIRNNFAAILTSCIARHEAKINEILADVEIAIQRQITGNNFALDELDRSSVEPYVKGGFNEEIVPGDEPIDLDEEDDDIDTDDKHVVKYGSAYESVNAKPIVTEPDEMDESAKNGNFVIPGRDWALYDAHLRDALSSTFNNSVERNYMNRATRMFAPNSGNLFGNQRGQYARAPGGMCKGDINSQLYTNSYASFIEIQEEITITKTTTTTTATSKNTATSGKPATSSSTATKAAAQQFDFRKRTATNDRKDTKKPRMRTQSLDSRQIQDTPRKMHLPSRDTWDGLSSSAEKNASRRSMSTPRTTQQQKAMKKRHSNLRRTVSSRSELVDEPSNYVRPKLLNTNRDMHSKNDYYRTLCVLCSQNEKFLAHHYATQHADREVFIARPSPATADRLRLQTDTFVLENKKISGFCYFCEETKTMPKHHWTVHYLIHTGEKLYYCSACNESSRIKSEHERCGNHVQSIYDANSIGSLMAYMCTKCNFLQVKRDRIILHVIMEHETGEAAEGRDFEKVILVPDMSPVQSKLLSQFEYVSAKKRYNCTICSKKMSSAKTFAQHFDREHNGPHIQTFVYNCRCGEVLSIDNCPLTGEFITAHLELHKTNLYLCTICDGIFYDQDETQNHLLNEHEDEQFKHEHVERGRKSTTITETTIRKLTCSKCKVAFQEPTFACATKHFTDVHRSDEVDLSGFVTTKCTVFTGIVSETKTTFKGGENFHLKLHDN